MKSEFQCVETLVLVLPTQWYQCCRVYIHWYPVLVLFLFSGEGRYVPIHTERKFQGVTESCPER